ncbi:MAG: hypothetical protein IJ437_01105 [Clostridia bacterium]|nr:hypothetical protein [Clostridia bacterium]
MVNQELKKTWRNYIKKARDKKFREETIKVMGMLALSKNAVMHFGNSQIAFEHLISLVDKYEEQEVFKLFTNEIGV